MPALNSNFKKRLWNETEYGAACHCRRSDFGEMIKKVKWRNSFIKCKPKNQTKGWPACLKHTLKERDHYSSIWRCPLVLFQSMFSTILENIFESIVWAVCGQIFVLMEFVQSLPFLLRDGWKMKESWKILPRKKHKVILFVDEDEEDEMTFGALVRIPSCRVGWFLNHDNGPAK